MDTVVLIGRLLVSLAAVLIVMWLLARRVRSSGRTGGGQLIDVLGRHQLSRTSSVAVVRIGEQALILGCTDTQITVLGQTELAAHDAPATAALPGAGAEGRIALDARPAGVAARPLDRPRALGRRNGTQPALSGSVLSPATWRHTVEALREMTARP